MELIEGKFSAGAIVDKPDIRDFRWGEEIGHASTPFDWSKGYDVEETLGKKLTIKDQNGSSSCGGQAWSYLGQVLDPDHAQKSAKFIYAQTFVGSGGSGGRENCTVCIKQGWGDEVLTPSYENGLPPNEAFMERVQDITPQARMVAASDKGISYANVSLNIDMIAQAIRDNKGCILGVTGQNNGTWRTAYPLPPISFSNSWNHWLYAGKAKMINGKKYIGFANSWGEEVGEDGWQWISEDYFTVRISGYPAIFSIWTMVFAQVNLPPTFHFTFTKTLRFGNTDSEVKMVQTALQLDGQFPKNITPTFYFGLITLSAVKQFQQKYGLISDGIVGKNTRAVLNKLFG